MMSSSDFMECLNRDGAFKVPAAVDATWLARAQRACTKARAAPSPRGEELDGFFSDLDTGDEDLRKLGREGPVARIAAEALGNDDVRFYHEHILVKDAGCATVTPLHADAAYYPLDGGRVISVWIALDHVGEDAALRFWRGSHAPPLLPKQGALWQPRRFASGDLYDAESTPPTSSSFLPASACEYAVAPVHPPDDVCEEALFWACAPGDAIIFDAVSLPLTIHGAQATRMHALTFKHTTKPEHSTLGEGQRRVGVGASRYSISVRDA